MPRGLRFIFRIRFLPTSMPDPHPSSWLCIDSSTLLGHLKANGVLLPGTVGDLIRIRNCAIALAGFIALGMVFILLLGDSEDHPAGLMMGLALLVVASSGAALTHWSTRRCLVLLKTNVLHA